MRKYNIIYADPAWKFGNSVYQDNGRKSRELNKQYDTMTINQIKELPLENISADDCALFMWVTDFHLPFAFELFKKWGFKYRTIAFVWIKKTNKGNTYVNFAPWTLKSSEICLLGMRGTMGKLKTDNTIRQLIEAERTKHSKKPMEARERIEQLFADVNRIELFRRVFIIVDEKATLPK